MFFLLDIFVEPDFLFPVDIGDYHLQSLEMLFPQFMHFAFDFLDLGQFIEVYPSLHFTHFDILE